MNHRAGRALHTKPQKQDIEFLMTLTLQEVIYGLAVLREVQRRKETEAKRVRSRLKTA